MDTLGSNSNISDIWLSHLAVNVVNFFWGRRLSRQVGRTAVAVLRSFLLWPEKNKNNVTLAVFNVAKFCPENTNENACDNDSCNTFLGFLG
jgi:hypothetical protein